MLDMLPANQKLAFSTLSQSDYVLQQWRCNKWRAKYPSELVSYERTVWPITIFNMSSLCWN